MMSFVAKRALGNAADKVKDQNDKAGGVNWQEFNWPPCLTIVHFDPRSDPIPPLARDTVLFMRNVVFFAMAILIWNICSNIGFVAAKAEKGIVLFYSCMQFAVGSVSGGVVLYQGYRGIAGDLARSSRIYLIAQGILTVFMIVFCAITSGNVHGLAGIAAHKDDRPQPGYMIMCVFEGLFWLSCSILSLVAMYRVYCYPGHERAARDAAAETSAAAAKAEQKPRRSRRTKEAANAAGDEEAPPPRRSSKSKKGRKLPPPIDEDQV